jgi:hypothetical protein
MGRTKELFEEMRLQEASNEFFYKKITYVIPESNKNCDIRVLE